MSVTDDDLAAGTQYSDGWVEVAESPPAASGGKTPLLDPAHLGDCASKYVDFWSGYTTKYLNFVSKSFTTLFDAMSPDNNDDPPAGARPGPVSETNDFLIRKLDITDSSATGVLGTKGFERRGVIVIPPTEIEFDPPALTSGTTSVVMKIKKSAIPTKNLALFAVVSDQSDKSVCDTVRLNTPIKKLSG